MLTLCRDTFAILGVIVFLGGHALDENANFEAVYSHGELREYRELA